MTWSERYKAKKAAVRQRKLRRKGSGEFWSAPLKGTVEVEADPKPWVPNPAPSTWYEFCTDRYYAYLDRGEPEAAMVYWTLRFLPEMELDPCTEDGYQDLCGYWGFKADQRMA